ncbi:Hypothetical protein PHPALM_9814 [Phytophthora palmivora]|uniref:Uncharacterized protein n=1 Tax=Phytophthora palmivora TaxID=4796 RepID=A0A2P4Y6D1_9STRA|nr:Hypothetical protein PHPALM_9814 [Phytophthora palmivora]
MDYLDAARRAPWVVVYLAAGVGVLANLLGETYSNAVAVCEMYPQFSFHETLLEELTMHHTRLPLVRVHVSTLHLLGAYVAVYAAKYCGLLDRGWPLLLDVLSEPDVPELLSEDEARAEDEDEDGGLDDVPPVDDDACNEALAKLVQEKLVLQKHVMRVNGRELNGHNAEGSKVSLPREQEPIGDRNQVLLPAADAKYAAKRVGKDVDTETAMNQPQEVATGIRTRL